MPQRGDNAQIDHRGIEKLPLTLTTVPPSTEQRRLAGAVTATVVIVAAAVAPFAGTQLPRIDAFVPVIQTVLATADFITAVLLLAQYAIVPQRALLAIASAYLCSASFAFLQTLTFPGGYAPGGLFGDGFNSPAWFFVLWHVTFPLGVLAYTLLKDIREPTAQPYGSTGSAIGYTILGVLLVVSTLSWLVTAEVQRLPAFYEGSVVKQTNLGNLANTGLLLWYSISFLTLFVLRRTILDAWLIVILVAWMPNFLVAALASSVRFSLGWYAARGFALVASFMLLSVLLTEMTVLYSRLANAYSLLRRERANRLMSVDAATAAIAHEVRAPLAAIALNASTCLVQLRSRQPPLEAVDSILEDIEADCLRASAVITSIRSLFKLTNEARRPASLGNVARTALALSEPDLLNHQTSVTTEFDDSLEVDIDQIQLQQVVLNLIRNAIDAMNSVEPGARHLKLITKSRTSTVSLEIQDAGKGVPTSDQARIFDAFFTTKNSGMGLGLAVSRTIVESHGGTLRLVRSGQEGSTFEINLPAVSVKL